MRKTTLFTLFLALALLSAPTFAANSLDVNGGAALTGSFGLEVIMDGTSNLADVRNSRPDGPGDPSGPNDETVYRASFEISMNDLVMIDNRQHHILTVRSRAGGPSGVSNRNEMRVFVRYADGDTNPYKLRQQCRRDDGSWQFVGGHSLPPSNTRTITIEWAAATADGADDGICRLFVNGTLRAERTDINNDERTIGQVRLGVDGVDAGTIGSQFYDTFESFRTLAP